MELPIIKIVIAFAVICAGVIIGVLIITARMHKYLKADRENLEKAVEEWHKRVEEEAELIDKINLDLDQMLSKVEEKYSEYKTENTDDERPNRD